MPAAQRNTSIGRMPKKLRLPAGQSEIGGDAEEDRIVGKMEQRHIARSPMPNKTKMPSADNGIVRRDIMPAAMPS